VNQTTEDNYLRNLLRTERWENFLKSTAAGLQIYLSFFFVDDQMQFTIQSKCPLCEKRFTTINEGILINMVGQVDDCPLEFVTEDGANAVIFRFSEDCYIVTRECQCYLCNGYSLKERTVIAQKLLSSFIEVMGESVDGGQPSIELLALHQMNHMILSMFGGDEDAVNRSFDLVLSALIILLDARASWLELVDTADLPQFFTKGDTVAIDNYFKNNEGCSEIADICNSTVHGHLGVLAPCSDRTSNLMQLLAQECTIIIEIDQLFKLLHKQLNYVFGAIGSAVLLVDKRGVISYANQAAVELLSRSLIDLIGHPVADIAGPWDAFVNGFVQQRINGCMDPFGKKDDRRWLDWEVSPLFEEQEIAGWIILLNDRTDYYRWQIIARKAERLYTTSTMVGSLAHELRNPLAAAKGLLQLITRQEEPLKVRVYTDLVLRELDRVIQLINEFLLLGKPADISAVPLDIVDFINELMPLLSGQALANEIYLRFHVDQVRPVFADPGQLKQVVMNLVRNAFEACDRDGEVVLSVHDTECGVTLSIQDNGPGLQPEALDRMFEPFFTTKEGGTGLGLPIVQAIVNNHGGWIEAANAKEGGAIIKVTLPVDQIGELPGRHVAVILRDKSIRYPLEQALRAAGFDVQANDNLNGAFSQGGNNWPGFTILEQQQATPETMAAFMEHCPETIIFAIGEGGALEDGQKIHYVPLPVDYAKLVAQLHMLLHLEGKEH
jgi:signal transduction histidine kinase